MDISTIKIDLIHWLTELQDPIVLEQLQTFKHQQEEGLGEAHQALLDERITSYESDPNKVLDWDDIMNELEKDQ